MSGEIPATKLAALQKVLQSDFLNAVREVYEHVYETVDIQHGSQDVRASATAKATVCKCCNKIRGILHFLTFLLYY